MACSLINGTREVTYMRVVRAKLMSGLLHRRAYLKYRDRQRLQKEEDRRTIEELHSRLKQLQCERSDLEKRVELLQKVWSPEG